MEVVRDTTYYDILEISIDATEVEIKQAYKRKARIHHPVGHSAPVPHSTHGVGGPLAHGQDKNPDDPSAHETFQRIGLAYETLSNPNDRATYDMHGPSGAPRIDPMEDVFNDMFSTPAFGFESFFSSASFNTAGPSRKPTRGKDTVVPYDITLEEAFKGKRVVMNLSRDRVCGVCQGSGARTGAKARECGRCDGKGSVLMDRHLGPGLVGKMKVPCPECEGEGTRIPDRARCKKCKGTKVVKEKKRVEFMIDPGTEDGERIALKGEGDEQPGVPPGDVIFRINIPPHSVFRVRPNGGLGITLPLKLVESLLGFSRVAFTHLDGVGVRIECKRGERVIRHGEELIILGEGMPMRGTGRRGDLRVRWEVEMPSTSWALAQDPSTNAVTLPPPSKDIEPLPEEIRTVYLSPLR